MKAGKKSRKRNLIGAAVMVGLIVIAMPMGAARSLEGLRDEAEGDFYYDNAGYSIYDGLEKRREAAHNLLTVAGRYEEANPELTPFIEELEYQVQACENARDDTFYWEGASNAEMGAAAERLAEALEKITLDGKDEKYPGQMIAQMRSEQDKIERSSYNDAAREFNGRLRAFPVNILRPFTGVKELIPFDEHGAGEASVVEDREQTYAVEEAEQGQRAEDLAEDIEDRVEAWVDDVVEEATQGMAERP